MRVVLVPHDADSWQPTPCPRAFSHAVSLASRRRAFPAWKSPSSNHDRSRALRHTRSTARSIGAIATSPLLMLTTAQGAFYNLSLALMMIAWADRPEGFF